MYNAKMAKPHCIFVPAARAAGCDLSVLLCIYYPKQPSVVLFVEFNCDNRSN